MTVGIVLSNGSDAVAITDSRVSNRGRKSDSVTKIKLIGNGKYSYHGVIFGAGHANLIEGSFSDITSKTHDNLDDCANFFFESYKKRIINVDDDYLKTYKDEINTKSNLYDDENEKKNFINTSIKAYLDKFDSMKNQDKGTILILCGYDKLQNRLRLFNYNSENKFELFGNKCVIGSGDDGAEMYFGSKLQGIDKKDLNTSELLFYSLNAYSYSTLNHGVGGTPKIVLINKNETKKLDENNTLFLTNLSGVYLSELNSNFNSKVFLNVIDNVYKNSKQIDDKLFHKFNLNKDILYSTYIPYSSWQEKSNRKNRK